MVEEVEKYVGSGLLMSRPAERLMSRSEPAEHAPLARCAGTALRAEMGPLAPFYPPAPFIPPKDI